MYVLRVQRNVLHAGLMGSADEKVMAAQVNGSEVETIHANDSLLVAPKR